MVAFRDIPQPLVAGISDIPKCVEDRNSFASCQFNEQRALSRDIVLPAAEQVLGTKTVDLSALFCPHMVCQPEIDGILVWIDGGHMSSYFAKGLAAALAARLDAIITAS